MTKQNSVDPRVARTKRRLFESLLGLIQERRWDKIRVQDILNDSGISRSAFYTHFSDKYDLLTGEMPEFVLPTTPDGRPDVVPLFIHVDEMSDVIRPLLSQPVLSDVIETFHRSFLAVWTDYLATTDHADDPVLPTILAGSISTLIRSYALDNEREDPEVFAAVVNQHITRLLDT